MNSFGVKKIMEIDPILLTILGVAAGILILTGWVDQIYKGYKSKSLKDVSSFLLIFISAGAILWLIYGSIVVRHIHHRHQYCSHCNDHCRLVMKKTI